MLDTIEWNIVVASFALLSSSECEPQMEKTWSMMLCVQWLLVIIQLRELLCAGLHGREVTYPVESNEPSHLGVQPFLSLVRDHSSK